MPDMEKVINALTLCTTQFDISVAVAPCKQCPYYTGQDLCDIRQMMLDTIELLKEQDEERNRMITWLGKFCRHIDNGDKWLPDEENIEFFRKKMKLQFGWDAGERSAQ